MKQLIKNRLEGLLRAEKGFTLVELVFVIAVIAIIVAIALPQFGHVRETANITQAESELKSIQSVLEIHYVRENEYPEEGDVTNIDGMDRDILQHYDNNGDYTKVSDDEYNWTYDVGNVTVVIDSDGQLDRQ